MDQTIRNQLQRATQDARRLLESEFAAQLEGTFDILPDGTILTEPGAHLNDRQQLVRHKIVEAIEHIRLKNAGKTTAQAVDDYLREAAFTFLNRFAALKMLEARGLVQQCVSKGDQSSGFKEFVGLAPGLGSLPDKGYQLYLECLFDELGTEISVLFDRRDSASLLWPRRQPLLDLLDILNREALQGIWGDDETIGWIYQYFNSQEERRKMRDESAAPRNSRELAVRNQFFTPRYVVEFLTDNTLGRIWYEMTQGRTALKDSCRYLVRRPNEIFLKEGEQPAAQDESASALPQEELLKQPVNIPFRAIRDPRDLKMLDPACGSMHFGLYAFDLFERIYEEAWDMQACDQWQVAPGQATFYRPLATDYPTKAAFLREVPRLIIEHNIHGIDIDPRAVQIAGLSLWLRAQKSWQAQVVKPQTRPQIRRSNIACAEPMPGEEAFLEEFIAQHLSGDPERQFLAGLVRKVFDSMKLAGEAGALLKIEEEIADEVARSKQQWLDRPALKQQLLFADTSKIEQKELNLTPRITDESFWDAAEGRIYEALRAYSEQAAEIGGYQRRLFANDAAHGFAFIDLCRQRYDIVLMNPPFGDCTDAAKLLVFAAYGRERIELGGCFITRFTSRLQQHGKLGVIANRTLLFAASLDEWRCRQLAGVETVVDLGHGVLDALVETAALTLRQLDTTSSLFIGAIDAADKEAHVETCVRASIRGCSSAASYRAVSEFKALDGAPFAYWAPPSLISTICNLRSAESFGAIARQGLATCDNFRFVRLAQEIPRSTTGWVPLTKGGEYQPFWADVPLRVNWVRDGSELKAYIENLHGQWSRVVQSTHLYGIPGATYSERTASSLSMRILPLGCIFDKVGPFVGSENPILSKTVALTLIGISYTTPYRFLIETSVGLRDGTTSGSAARHYLPSMIQRLPWPELDEPRRKQLEDATRQAVAAARELSATTEPNTFWHEPYNWSDFASLQDLADAQLRRHCELLSCIYKHAEILEELSRRIFGIQESDEHALEAVAGRSALSYEISAVSDPEQLRSLLDMPPEELIALLVAEGKAHATIFKKAYWGDRGIELVAHLWETHPISLLTALKTQKASTRRIAITAWRVLSASVALVFGRIEPAVMFRNASDVVPEDLFSLTRLDDHSGSNGMLSNIGILCDDPGHEDDLVERIERLLSSYWGEHASEQVALAIDNTQNTLRAVVRKQFFVKHLSEYSEYRRQAPIYWALSTASNSYTLWLYYHGVRRDTLSIALEEYAKPKLRHEQKRLDEMRREAGLQPTRTQREEIDAQETLVNELSGFSDELARVAPLWSPDHNDGVIINSAPLWRMIGHTPWRNSVKDCWETLCAGDYDWAHLAMHLWPERVVPKCQSDASMAIAHGLDDVFWLKDDHDRFVKQPVPTGGWQPVIDRLVAERTSAAVKSALDSLLTAPPLTGAGGGRRGSRSVTAPRRTRTTSPEETSDAATTVRSRSRTPAPTTDVETLEMVKNVIAAAPDGASKTDVLTATSLSEARWTAAINTLLQQGYVTKTGERRGTRYHIADGVGVEDSPTTDESEDQE